MGIRKGKGLGSGQKVLIIDDEPDFVDAFRRTLEAKCYNVITTNSRPEAQESMGQDPDLVILGTISPAGEAFRIHEWMKGHPRYKDIPLLVVDAQQNERAIRGWRKFEGMRLQAEEYVAKPIEPASLVPRIRSLLEEALRKIRVLVADDHTMVRDGICAVLALQKDIEIAGEAINGRDALDKVYRLMPNVTLMDIVMPVMSGIEATKVISTECPQTKVLILTQYDEEENMCVAKQAGAHGFIPKRAASSDLASGIRTVFGGKHFPASFDQVTAS